MRYIYLIWTELSQILLLELPLSVMYALKKFDIYNIYRTKLYKFISLLLTESFEKFYVFTKVA